MSEHFGVPLSSVEIPAGTGLVQAVECKGLQYGERDTNGATFLQPLELAVIAQITTFANGIRRVCCVHAQDRKQAGEYKCHAGGNEMKGALCIYGWADPKPKHW